MPASPSRSRAPKRSPISLLTPLIVLGVVLVLVIAVMVLPASLAARFLPTDIRAEEFSGSVWHGLAQRILVNGRDAGALEWHLHPAALLGLALAADLHWVKVSSVLDASVTLTKHGFTARDVHGAGSLDDLRELGVAAGYRGNTNVEFSEISGDYAKIQRAVGSIRLTSLSAAGLARGAPLGSYELQLAPAGIAPDGTVSATLHDTGGPLQLEAMLSYSPATRIGLLSGTLMARPDASAALREQLSNLAQLKAPDASGRIPVDLEFAL